VHAVCATVLIGLLSLATPASAVTVGALGDSLVDEYLGTPGDLGATNLPALNWVQLLVQTRGVDFGSFEAANTVRGEPRNEGYEHNWARSGAGALPQLFADVTVQATGLAGAVAGGGVDAVSIAIGANDFFFRELASGTMDTGDPDYLAFEQAMLDNMETAITTIQAAGSVDILVAVVPMGTAGGTDPDTVAAIAHYNGELATLTTTLGATLYDQWAWTTDPARVDPMGNLLFAGHVIPQSSVATLAQTIPEGTPGAGPCDAAGNCGTLAYALNFIASDNLHPNTVVQGMLANAFLTEVNPFLDTPVALLTDEEILALASGSAAVPTLGPLAVVLLAAGLAGIGIVMLRRRELRRPV
jgi:hypothetical protein